MAPVYDVIRVREESAQRIFAPNADNIALAFRDAMTGRPAQYGRWVGPRPRITRTDSTFGTAQTRAVWVVEWRDGDAVARNHLREALSSALAAQLLGALHRHTDTRVWDADWLEPVVEPYRPETHGPLAWWQSGEASITRTQNEFPDLPARLTQGADNPGGPTTDNTHPATLPDAARELGKGVGDGAKDAASGLAWIVGGAAVTAAVVAVVLARRQVVARENPRRRRRTRR